MHLDTCRIYNQGCGCEQDIKQFKSDLEDDLKTVRRLSATGQLGPSPVIVLNTFNRHWLRKTHELLGGKRFPGVALSKIYFRLYSPERHKEIFSGMFPGCDLINPGREDPESWDLIVSSISPKETALP